MTRPARPAPTFGEHLFWAILRAFAVCLVLAIIVFVSA